MHENKSLQNKIIFIFEMSRSKIVKKQLKNLIQLRFSKHSLSYVIIIIQLKYNICCPVLFLSTKNSYLKPCNSANKYSQNKIAQSAGAVEYTDCFSAEG